MQLKRTQSDAAFSGDNVSTLATTKAYFDGGTRTRRDNTPRHHSIAID
jgi:hypothetical protein